MNKYFFLTVFVFSIFSCKTHPNSDRHYDDSKNGQSYALRLNPVPGSQYLYTIHNESEVKMEVGDRKMDNDNKSDVSTVYAIGRDSIGDFIMGMTYEKIHLYVKNNGEESEMDAANAGSSINPVERMLGALQSAHVEARISPAGEVKSVTGYKEIGEKILGQFHAPDSYSQNLAKQR
ncbi:MAG: DUF6263 family protein, partial [Ignavibacteriaceae bacterium]|nr:DUF6263 family protein [Ignavibacteriaceae bacterium]